MSLSYAPGTPCWVDLTTSDPAAACTFYAEVLGWTFSEPQEGYGDYRMAHADGAVVAGLGPIPEGMDMPPAWTVYLAVADLKAAADGFRRGGAAVLAEPMEVPEHGHMAIVADPGGAVVGLWQATGHSGFEALGSPGAPCWFEVNTPRADDVRDFFVERFGLEAQRVEGMHYHTLHEGGRPRWGILQMTQDWEGIPPHWMSYFAVDDADAAVERVQAAGGKVNHGPFDTPFGRIAICSDPQGAVFTVIKPA